jgi:hypothetical protein
VSRLYEICGEPLPMWGLDHRIDRDFVLPSETPRDDDAEWEGATPSRYGRRPLD